MKTIFQILSKSDGREWEGDFTTSEKAEAALWANEYYLGYVTTSQVSDEEYQELLAEELASEELAEEWGEGSVLEDYRYALSAMREADQV
jgi:adenosyl cobinamide kinase/adenosyl cobinamide phosphate guanylyltransferase